MKIGIIIIIIIISVFTSISSETINRGDKVMLREFKVDQILGSVLDSLISIEPFNNLDTNEHYVFFSSPYSTQTIYEELLHKDLECYYLTKKYSTNEIKYEDAMIGYIKLKSKYVFVVIESDINNLFSPTGNQKMFEFVSVEYLILNAQDDVMDDQISIYFQLVDSVCHDVLTIY